MEDNSIRPKTVCVYGASSARIDPIYLQVAKDLGSEIAKKGWIQVNGGGKTGCMGAATDGGVENGGVVDAVILDIFTSDNLHPKLRNVKVESTMTLRKKGLYDYGDAFVALPGGLGTMEEIMEIMSWRQLRFHDKPIAIMNIDGFYSPIRNWLQLAIDRKFVYEDMKHEFRFCDTAQEAIEFIDNYKPKFTQEFSMHLSENDLSDSAMARKYHASTNL